VDSTRDRDLAINAARAAGKYIKERLGNISRIDYKSAYNIVTDVDKATEKLILDMIKSENPDDSVVAEEGGGGIKAGDRCWFIDPLDGTTNFTHTYPFFCVSIGLEVAGKMAVGVVYNPISDELFSAEGGKGAFLNDAAISVSKIDKLETSLLATGFPADTATSVYNNLEIFKELTNNSHGVRRDGSAALDLCFVACGRLDAFWEMKLAPWDVAAGSLIVAEAGGRVTNLISGPFDKSNGHIIASNGLIHDEVVATLKTFKVVQKVHGLSN
jgi:myo-inositol-1(or 4)-monophosphatase